MRVYRVGERELLQHFHDLDEQERLELLGLAGHCGGITLFSLLCLDLICMHSDMVSMDDLEVS